MVRVDITSAHADFIDAGGSTVGTVPIAVLPDEYMGLIGAKTNIILLSSDTLQKNVAHHPEVVAQDYLNLQAILDRANVVVQDGENTLVFIETGDRIFHAAIKATRTGNGLFVTSLRKTNRKALNDTLKAGKIIKN